MAPFALTDLDLLALWEAGARLHPLDRSLLFYGGLRTEQAGGTLADLPLGTIQIGLLELRSAWFGPWIELWQACPACGSRQETQLDCHTLLTELKQQSQQALVQVSDHTYRLPSTRDLAALIHQPDQHFASRILLERCLLPDPAKSIPKVLNPSIEDETDLVCIEAALDAADPAADIALTLCCSDCGKEWSSSLDISAVLWGDITARAQALLLQVHQLAKAYGWHEGQILALSPWRRAAYLNLVA